VTHATNQVMRQLLTVIAVVCASAPVVLAQWPRYVVPGVPRTADGKPDLNAPAPRAPNGTPDLSGIWENFRKPGDAPVRSVNAQFFDDLPATLISEFRDIGAGVSGGLPLQPWAATLKQQRMTENSKDNPDAHCLPMGVMQMTSHPYPKKIIQTPSVVVLIYEGSGTTSREVFLDGRPLPNPADVEPWWNGYSVGRWEGDTLVIETTGFMDDGWLDVRGSPFTSAGKLTERIRRPNYGSLVIEVTIDDPKAYTKPFTATVNNRLLPDTQLIEFVCIDKSAQHYVGSDGKAGQPRNK
jgi:hypothetical protein